MQQNKMLVDYLNKCDLSTKEFADILGVTEGGVRHWLFNRRDIPETVLRIIDYFEEDIRDFYTVEEEE